MRATQPTLTALLPVLGALVGFGCGDPLSNVGLRNEGADGIYRAAVPREQDLTLVVPDDEGSTEGSELGLIRQAMVEGCVASGRARFFCETADFVKSLNQHVFGILRMVTFVVDQPPTERTEDSRLWGPFESDDHAQTTWFTFRMERLPDGVFDWEFAFRRDEDPVGPYTPYVWGSLLAGRRAEDGLGTLTFDLAAMSGADNTEETGRADIEYDTRGCGISMRLHLQNLRAADAPEGVPGATGLYSYRRDCDGSGSLEYYFVGDTDSEDGAPTSCLETFSVVTRWLRSGAGRADITILGGELGFWRVLASQCWNPRFRQTWSLWPEEVGTEASCAFDDRAEPERIDPPIVECRRER